MNDNEEQPSAWAQFYAVPVPPMFCFEMKLVDLKGKTVEENKNQQRGDDHA